MSTKLLNRSGCITVRSTAHVPPIDQPTMPQSAGLALVPKCAFTYGTTSLVRWSATLPRTPLTHSVSLLNDPPESTNTNTGALPPCALGEVVDDRRGVAGAQPVGRGVELTRDHHHDRQLGRRVGGEPLRRKVDQFRSVLEARGGARECRPARRCRGIGTVPAFCIAAMVAGSVSSGSGPAVSWFQATCTVGK